MSWIAVVALVAVLPAPAAIYQDTLREAKALFFDRDYASARDAWNRIREAEGPESDVALYWIGRCSESLDQPRRALREYGEKTLDPDDSPVSHSRVSGRSSTRRPSPVGRRVGLFGREPSRRGPAWT